jgi:sulfite dehydrogenase (cytochrome) subunit B
MGMTSRAIAAAVFGAFFSFGVTSAQSAPPPYKEPEETSVLAPGPNADLAQAYCGACHSYEYIFTQPRGQGFGRDFWQAEVTKMIKVFGAQINEKEASAIVDYLAATYK